MTEALHSPEVRFQLKKRSSTFAEEQENDYMNIDREKDRDLNTRDLNNRDLNNRDLNNRDLNNRGVDRPYSDMKRSRPSQVDFDFSLGRDRDNADLLSCNHPAFEQRKNIKMMKFTPPPTEGASLTPNVLLCSSLSSSGEILNIEQERKYHESQMLSVKTQYQLNTDKLSSQLERTRKENEVLSRASGAMGHHAEENKVLKRAVGIQDNRYNELLLQTQQYQRVIAQATAYVSNLQQVNKNLENELIQTRAELALYRAKLGVGLNNNNSRNYNNNFFPDQEPRPPPDVF